MGRFLPAIIQHWKYEGRADFMKLFDIYDWSTAAPFQSHLHPFMLLLVHQVQSDLTDHYYEELQQIKTRHALELEQLRAKLSDRHLQGSAHVNFMLHE